MDGWEGKVKSHIKGQYEFLGSANNNLKKRKMCGGIKGGDGRSGPGQRMGLLSVANTKSHAYYGHGHLGLVLNEQRHNAAWLR